ncbi:FecR family protein [Chitinophaga sp. 30R24]|uniref:FecR family protein n=1 Tax=Chitinophaga sp. 30R24 TaxID=3248838 RepID=UPI003B8ED8FB
MDYGEFDAADLAADTSFRAWVLRKDMEATAFWTNWLTTHPDKGQVVQEAKNLVLALRFQTNEVSESEMAAVKYQIDLLLNEAEVTTMHRLPHRRLRYALVAAAATVLLLIGGWYYLASSAPGKILVQTGFGETKSLRLPDGSLVQLNANSSVTYPRVWSKEKVRTVALTGEAYFNVSKAPAGLHPKFRVQMPGVAIEVKGTAFNVYSRHHQVKVLLEEGKIVVNDSLHMLPGDIMFFAPGVHRRLQADPSQLTAWKQHRLVFRDEPLISIAQQLEDTYGYHIQFGKKRMENLLFTGAGPADDPALLLSAIATVHQLTMKQKHSLIIFE